jgi:HTH-type transcriptional regulator, sugar sensing transcriptional regulator
MQPNVQIVLRALGLNEKEITVYLTLLKVGPSPASMLGKRTNIVRSTAQYTCQQLAQKGIVRMTHKGTTNLFCAEPPEKLALLIGRERLKLDEKEHQLKGIVDMLTKMMEPGTVLPRVEFYEGKQEMILLYKKILEIQKPIDSIEGRWETNNFFPEFVEEFIKLRIRKKIFNRVICASESTINRSKPEEFRDIRTFAAGAFLYNMDIKICDDYVCMFTFDSQHPIGVSIHHRDISKNLRSLFEVLWQLLQK